MIAKIVFDESPIFQHLKYWKNMIKFVEVNIF